MSLGGWELFFVGLTADLAKSLWGEVAKRVAKRGVDWGEKQLDALRENDGRVIGEMEATLAARRDVAEEVRAVVAARSGQRVILPELPGAADAGRLIDVIVSAYQAALYDVAALSALKGQSVVIEGFFQGPDWLLACDRHSGATESPGLPDPGKVWQRSDAPSLDRPMFPQFDFHLRHVVDPNTRSKLRTGAERRARTSDRIVAHEWPPEETPFDDRWIELLGVAPYFVRLDPYGEAILKISSFDREFGLIKFEDYPETWQELIEVADPLAGVERVRTAVRELAKSDATTRQRLDASFR